MKHIILIFLSVMFFFFIGCGDNNGNKGKDDSKQEESSDENLKEEENNKDSESRDEYTESMKNFTDMMKGGEKVEPIDFRKLKEFLPDGIDGMKRTSATGEKTNSFGIKISEATGNYQSDNGNQITITITDLGSIKGVAGMAAFAWAYAEVDKETETGYEKTTKYSGYKAFERYDTEYRNGSIEVLVGDRFMVKAEGNDVPMETIKSAIEEIKLNDLEDLKEEGKEN